jgi:hypothetical protein
MNWGRLYAEAVERENDVRDLAFLGQPESIFGVEVRPLTSRHILWLQLTRSPLLTGAPVELPMVPGIIAQFLRIIINHENTKTQNSKLKTQNSFKLIDSFIAKSIKGKKLPELVMAIKGHLDEAFMDAPGGKPSRAYYSRITPLVHFLCSEENLTIEQALDTPLKVVFQLMKVCRQQNNPKCLLFNPSDNITAQWLKSEDGSQKAEAGK